MKPRTFLRFRVRTQHWSKLNPRPAPYPSVVRGRPESRDYARDSLSHMLLHIHELKANPPESPKNENSKKNARSPVAERDVFIATFVAPASCAFYELYTSLHARCAPYTALFN